MMYICMYIVIASLWYTDLITKMYRLPTLQSDVNISCYINYPLSVFIMVKISPKASLGILMPAHSPT